MDVCDNASVETGIRYILDKEGQIDIVVNNAGPDAAENVVVTDTLPAGVTLVSTSGCAEDPNGVPTPGFEVLLPWAYYPAVLDTFFLVTERPAEAGVPKDPVNYYRHHDDVYASDAKTGPRPVGASGSRS